MRLKIINLMQVFIASIVTTHAFAYTVPFNNVILNPNAILSAGYSFGNNAIIFCYTPDLATTGIITWPYKGITQSGSLPMSLTNNSNATGQFADSQGSITIKNTLNSTIIVSCNFAFLKN